uniref:Tc1-like transposase DDE domain-containing protein n=1 Tax=Parascaris univalens TaxID=6257 RepID=A0A914ZYY9_PARUN
MFVAVERGTANAVIFKVPDRTGAALQVDHSQNVAQTVMHSDEPLPVHANPIEGMWSHAKRKFKEMLGTSKENFESYIFEFIFRRMTKHSEFPCLIDTAGLLYDPPLAPLLLLLLLLLFLFFLWLLLLLCLLLSLFLFLLWLLLTSVLLLTLL